MKGNTNGTGRARITATDSERGSVLLEFIASCMLLLVFFVGLVNIGLLVKSRLAVAEAAREAARFTAVYHSSWRGYDVARRILADAGIQNANIMFNTESNGQIIRVRVDYDFPVFLPLAGGFMGGEVWDNTVTLSSTKRFRLEP